MTEQPIDTWQFIEPEPTTAQKAMWDRFVEEYVKDYNAVAANMRVGFNMTYAQEFARQFLSMPYVQRKIMEHKNRPQPDEATRIAQLKARVEALYIQAMECGDPKVAVVAATRLGEMHGFMEAPDKSGDQLKELVGFFKEVAKVVPD